MIRVTIYQNEKKECAGFKAFGHAGYNSEGQDIVCAAASVLMINTINSIEAFADDKVTLVSDDTEGLIDYQFQSKPTKEAALLLKAMLLGLEAMADDENYAKYIHIIFEEV